MKAIGLAVALMLLTSAALGQPGATGQDHLLPENSLLSTLMNALSVDMPGEGKAFQSVLDDSVQAAAIIAPAFTPEFTVGLKRTGDGYRIFGARLTQTQVIQPIFQETDLAPLQLMGRDGKPLSKAENDSRLSEVPPAPKDEIKLTHCNAPIDTELATRILAAWKTVVSQTRYEDNPNIGADGVFDHFAVRVGYQVFAGQIWSPPALSNPYQLETIAFALDEFCDSGAQIMDKSTRDRIENALGKIH